MIWQYCDMVPFAQHYSLRCSFPGFTMTTEVLGQGGTCVHGLLEPAYIPVSIDVGSNHNPTMILERFSTALINLDETLPSHTIFMYCITFIFCVLNSSVYCFFLNRQFLESISTLVRISTVNDKEIVV